MAVIAYISYVLGFASYISYALGFVSAEDSMESSKQ